MSIMVITLVDDAALAIGDPAKRRVQVSEWASFYNRSARELCAKIDILQLRSVFNLGPQAAYGYPDEMQTMTGIEVTETPDNVDSWRQLTEVFEEEHRATVSGYYGNNTLPESYFAAKLGFYLLPRPTATIAGGGRITYFGLPDRITDATTATFQLPAIAQDYVLRRMIVFGKMARNRVAEANAELQQWYSDLDGLWDRMEDRSSDRRQSLRPRRNPYAGMR